jgi:hypothetical protein
MFFFAMKDDSSQKCGGGLYASVMKRRNAVVIGCVTPVTICRRQRSEGRRQRASKHITSGGATSAFSLLPSDL